MVTSYPTEMGNKIVPHPPYSPDMSPCDFWMFPRLKEKLRGRRFEDVEEMREGCDRGPGHLHFGRLRAGLQEVAGALQQVH